MAILLKTLHKSEVLQIVLENTATPCFKNCRLETSCIDILVISSITRDAPTAAKIHKKWALTYLMNR